MTRERLEEIAKRGFDFTSSELDEILALARRGLEAEEVLEAYRSQSVDDVEQINALRRACELAREYRRAWDQVSYIEESPPEELENALDAALAAVGMPVDVR